MPLNIPGILVPFQLLLNPRLVLPAVTITDIRRLNFAALRKAGYRGAVFDKDNCITIPYKDTLAPEVQAAWDECKRTFGDENVLIVSNSAGTRQDPGQIKCESVSHHTGVPVLRHKALKPAYSCIHSIHDYFSSLQTPIQPNELIIVGDRIFTDVVMANRMLQRTHSSASGGATPQTNGPLAIWTTGVWKKESMIMRWFEKKLVGVIRQWNPMTEKQEINAIRFVRRDL